MRIVSAVIFYPRGGSAHAARALVRGLRADGCEVTLVAGSRTDEGAHGDARIFYGEEVRAVSFDQALASDHPLRFEGPAGTAPLHPSFEDRAGAPDKVFAMLDDLDFERQVRAWSRELDRAGAREADVLHLHHLTPLNEAAARVAPDVPVVGHLHGTEMLMLEQIDRGAPDGWTHATRWAERLRTWAHQCARLVVVPQGVERATALLGVPPERLFPLPSGVDIDAFARRALDRQAFWRRVLVDEPQGWLPGEGAGSASYDEAQVSRLADGTVLLYVGRFTAVKRLDVLIGAFGKAHAGAGGDAALVLVGGHPGEWENEHPAVLARRRGVPDVFLAGWYAHETLPEFFSCADAVVLASEREQFGLVLVEGMACGLPAIATRVLGPAAIIEDGRTGWLVEPGDELGLAAAMAEVISDPQERRRRGQLGHAVARERFSWLAIAERLAGCFAEVVERRSRRVV